MKRRIAFHTGPIPFRDAFRVRALEGAHDYARTKAGWEVLHLCQRRLLHGYDGAADLRHLNINGVLIFSALDDVFAQVARHRIPAVTILPGDHGCPVVGTDNHRAGELAAAHLLERGYRQLAFYGNATSSWDRDRLQGFRSHASSLGVAVETYEPGTYNTLARRQRCAARLEQWLASCAKPLGILAADDALALHILDAAEAVGAEVPVDVGIMGIDDHPFITTTTRPTLSSISMNPRVVGWQAAALLEAMLDGEPAPTAPVRLRPEMVEARGSTDTFAAGDRLMYHLVRLIGEGLATPLSSEEIAEQLGVSRRTIEKRVRVATGLGLHELIQRRRIERAQMFLRDRTKSINEVARESGFATVAHFCRTFKKLTNQTPGEWRDKP